MKLSRVLSAVAVLVLAGMSAATVKADQLIDPSLRLADPACTGTPWNGIGSLDVDLSVANPIQAICYDGANTLTSLTITFDAPSNENFTFSGGSVADPGPFMDNANSPNQNSTPEVPCLALPCINIWTVTFSGPPGLTNNTGFQVISTGLTGDETLDLVLNTPESGTLLLLFVSLVPMIWFGRKFRGAAQSV